MAAAAPRSSTRTPPSSNFSFQKRDPLKFWRRHSEHIWQVDLKGENGELWKTRKHLSYRRRDFPRSLLQGSFCWHFILTESVSSFSIRKLPHLNAYLSWTTYTKWLNKTGFNGPGLSACLTQGHCDRHTHSRAPRSCPRLWQTCLAARLLSLLIPAPSPIPFTGSFLTRILHPTLSYVWFRRSQTVTAEMRSQIFLQTHMNPALSLVPGQEYLFYKVFIFVLREYSLITAQPGHGKGTVWWRTWRYPPEPLSDALLLLQRWGGNVIILFYHKHKKLSCSRFCPP